MDEDVARKLEDYIEEKEGASLLEIAVRAKSHINTDPIEGGIRGDIYKRLVDIEPINQGSIAFFIRSTLGQMEKDKRNLILSFTDSLHRVIEENPWILVETAEAPTCSLEDREANELFEKVMDHEVLSRGIPRTALSFYIEEEIRRTYTGPNDREYQWAAQNLENLLWCKGSMKLSYFLPYIYYVYMKRKFRINMNKKELDELETEIIELFTQSITIEGMMDGIEYVLEQL